jgi:hypothetical protein
VDLSRTTSWPRAGALRHATRRWVFAAYGYERTAALVMTLAIGIAIGVIAVLTPIVGRGDYGQWLMTSRYYLGQDVPAYRSVSALPPLVPVLLAGLRLVVVDQVAVLQLLDVLLVLGLAVSFYFVGSTLLRSAVGGALSVAAALLVTDRFLELSAFGGLLQLMALVWLNVAVGALVRAGDPGARRRRWWAVGGLSLGLLAVSHVGTATVGLPLGLALAGISLLRTRRLGLSKVLREAWPFMVAVVAIALYALLVLVPASRDYVTNPASLAYRGPSRLISGLSAYWPTTAMLVLGAVAVLLGSAAELLRRSPARLTMLLIWAMFAWGSVLVSAITGASTDYPRFSTLLLAPLAIGAAGALLVLARQIGEHVESIAHDQLGSHHLVAGAWLVILVAVPFSLVRYQSLMATYQPLDANGLTAAVALAETSLGSESGSVLTAVREGKWLEGMTGREALFSQPVRYAFRADEWQRSIDADVLSRSTAALTNQFFFVKFSNRVGSSATSAVTGMTIAMNHGGEFVDVLQLAQGSTQLIGAAPPTLSAETGPDGMSTGLTTTTATLTTHWRQARGTVTAAFDRSVQLLDGGSTMSVTDSSPGYRLTTQLRPPLGMAMTSVLVDGREARICMTLIGDQQPCVRIWVTQADATLTATTQGITLATSTSSRLEFYITDLTPGGTSAGLNVLDPARLMAEHNVRAAILVRIDPAYGERSRRLEALGFHELPPVGIYAVLVRGATAMSQAPSGP